MKRKGNLRKESVFAVVVVICMFLLVGCNLPTISVKNALKDNNPQDTPLDLYAVRDKAINIVKTHTPENVQANINHLAPAFAKMLKLRFGK